MRRPKPLVAGFVLLTCVIASGQSKPDVWEPMKFFVGSWEGVGTGKPGTSKVQREYSFALNNKFLQVKNKSIYDPQPQNPKGEIHEDWGMISFDKVRKQFVFRQFHVEGFVNQYVVSSIDGKTIVLTSEHLENIPAGYRARETYKILNENEFEEVFEIAEPNKDFVVYTQNRLKRKL
jgi:hypothetical protein